MERKGLVLGAVVLVLLALGLGIYVNRGEEDARRGSHEGASEDGDARGSIGSAGAVEDRGQVRRERPRSFDEDGGVPRVGPLGRPLTSRPLGGPPSEPAAVGVERQRGAEDLERSSGWRLGQARQRISVVEPRVAHLRERVAGFEERGETANAERQRRILERFETRLGELRTEETELEAQARSDGTLGEAEQGFEDTRAAQGPERAPIPVQAPPSAP